MEKRELSAVEKLLLVIVLVPALSILAVSIIVVVIAGVITCQQNIEFKKTNYDSVIDLKESKKLASEIKDVFPSDTILYMICADEEDGQTTTSVYVRYRDNEGYSYGQEELSALYACILEVQSIFNSHMDYQTCQQSDCIEITITNRRYASLQEKFCFDFGLHKGTDGQFEVYTVRTQMKYSGCDLSVLASLIDVDVLYYSCSESTAEKWDGETFSQLAHLEKLYLYLSSGNSGYESEELRQFIEDSLPDCEIVWGWQ